jgi:hypothetical protein
LDEQKTNQYEKITVSIAYLLLPLPMVRTKEGQVSKENTIKPLLFGRNVEHNAFGFFRQDHFYQHWS